MHAVNRNRLLISLLLIVTMMISIITPSVRVMAEDDLTSLLGSDYELGTEVEAFASYNKKETLPDIVAETAIVMDANTGNILYEKNALDKAYPASTTKIITTTLALQKEGLSLNDTITMSEDAIWKIDRDSSNIALDVGEQISVEECLYAIMLPSANECAYAMAEYVGGTMKSFVDMMNDKAAELGCKNTHFVNPNGLPDENHYTCAYDLALFCREAMNTSGFRKYSSTYTYTISETNLMPETRTIFNTLGMLSKDSEYYYPYIEGGKTGSTDDAGFVLVSYAKKDGHELICVVTKSSSREQSFTDSIALYDYCFQNYTEITPLTQLDASLLESDDIISSNYWKTTNASDLSITYDKDMVLYVPNGITEDDITKEIKLYDTPKEDVIGQFILSYKNVVLGSTEIRYKNASLLPEGESILSEDEMPELNEFSMVQFLKKHIYIPIITLIILATVLYLVIKNAIDSAVTRKNRKSKKNFEQKGRHKY